MQTKLKVRNDDLDHAEFLEKVHYDPETGIMVWLTQQARRVKPGDKVGVLRKDGRTLVSYKDKKYLLHRLAWFYAHGKFPEGYLDHKNGVTSDNRLCNLRECTNGQNMANIPKRRDSKNPYKGVRRAKSKNELWVARITVQKKERHLGCFKTASEAYAAYCVAARKFHGEFARLA
jgi:hypothetical protein